MGFAFIQPPGRKRWKRWQQCFSIYFPLFCLCFTSQRKQNPQVRVTHAHIFIFRLSVTRARGNKSVRTHEFYLIVNNTGNSTRFYFLDDASDEVTKPRSVNVNLRPTQVHLVLTRRFFLILKRAYESLFVTIHKPKTKIIG